MPYEWMSGCQSLLPSQSCGLCLSLVACVQNESAEAAAIPAWGTGLEAPGHAWRPQVQLVQQVVWATGHLPKQQSWRRLQLHGGDVLRLVGKPPECPQGRHPNPALCVGEKVLGLGRGEGLGEKQLACCVTPGRFLCLSGLPSSL